MLAVSYQSSVALNSDLTLYTIIAVLALMALVVLGLIVTLAVVMRRTSRLAQALAAQSDPVLRDKLLAQSSWWPRFRMRTMLVVTLLCVIACGLFGAELRRARQQASVIDHLDNGVFDCEAHYERGILGDSALATLLAEWVHPDFGSTLIGLELTQSDYRDPLMTVTSADVVQLAKLKQLENLRVSYEGSGVPDFGFVLQLPKLRRLSVRSDERAADAVARIGSHQGVEILEIRGTMITKSVVEAISAMKQLKVLLLPVDITEDGFNSLPKLAHVEQVVLRSAPYLDGYEFPGNVVLGTEYQGHDDWWDVSEEESAPPEPSQQNATPKPPDSGDATSVTTTGPAETTGSPNAADPSLDDPFGSRPDVKAEAVETTDDGHAVSGQQAAADFDKLIEAMIKTVADDSWANAGGDAAAIRPFPTNLSLVVGGGQVSDRSSFDDNRPRFPNRDGYHRVRGLGGMGGGGFGGGGPGGGQF